MVARMEPQQPAEVIILGSHILPKPKMLQIAFTTFEAEGIQLPPQQLKQLKATSTERDEQKKQAMGDEEWHGLLDCTQRFFRAFLSWSG